MKFILLIIVSISLSASAQTNIVKVFTTNYVAAAANIREVDGKLYDINRSTNWDSVRCTYQNQSGEFAVFQRIDHVKIGQRRIDTQDSMSSMGAFSSAGAIDATPRHQGIYEDRDGALILLKNFPSATLVTGQELTPRLLRVSQTNYNGSVVAIYDCGTPHLVPVVTFKTVKLK